MLWAGGCACGHRQRHAGTQLQGCIITWQLWPVVAALHFRSEADGGLVQVHMQSSRPCPGRSTGALFGQGVQIPPRSGGVRFRA